VARRADEALFTELVAECRRGAGLQRQLWHPAGAEPRLRGHQRRPLVSGAAIGFDGQVSVYDPRQDDSPCYACVFPPSARPWKKCAAPPWACSRHWSVIIGALQATEALKLLCRHRAAADVAAC
jgi:molybdopterin/thiamine biosynthesis adenylyltransferase